MKFLFSSVVLAALLPVAAAAQSDDMGEPTDQAVHVTVKVTSQFYGSFTQERDVNLRETATFSNISGHHQSMSYAGPCQLTPAPHDIADGVTVKITPRIHSNTGVVYFAQDVVASKFLGYRVFNTGRCGEISEGSEAHDSSGSTAIYRGGKPLQITHSRDDSSGDHRDLDVFVTFTPAVAR